MNNKDKQRALIELGNASMCAMQKAIEENTGFVLGAILCSIKASYDLQASAIINHTGLLSSDKHYQMTQRPTEIITIKRESK